MSSLENLLIQLTGGDEVLAEAASAELARLDGVALAPLLNALKSSDVDERWWAVRTLARMDDPPVSALLGALGDPSSEVRLAAVWGLGIHPNMEMTSALVRALEDEDNMVATLAVKALASLGREAVPELLDKFGSSASTRGRIHILRALAEIRDHRAIPAMMRAMEEDSALLNYWAKEGLERLGLNMVYIKPG